MGKEEARASVRTTSTIGLLHPGEMGAEVGASLTSVGHKVLWIPEGRSRETLERAHVAGLTAVPTTNPKEALAGLITPLGGPKGSALAMAVDVLCALLSGSETSPDVRSQAILDMPQKISHFFLAIHIPAFIEMSQFLEDIDKMLERIRTSTPAANVEKIYAPGDIELAAEEKATAEGIKLQLSTWESLRLKSNKYKVELPNLL